MKIKAGDLKEGMIVVHTTGKGILTVHSVRELAIEIFPQKYEVTFHGIAHPEIYCGDDEVEVISDED